MNSREENDQRSRSGPRGGLESPFLAEELFVGEAEPEWEARLAALEAESPFRSAFEEGSATPFGPVEQEEEFVGEEWGSVESFSPEEAEAYEEEALAEPEESRELYYEEETPYEEGETDEEKPRPRMKFELQTGNRIWRNDGKTASLLERKYGPDDFLVDRKGVRLESETNGVLEFETEWFRSWPKLKEAMEKAVKMTDDMNRAVAAKYEKSRKAFPFSVDHLRKGSKKEIAQGFWDKRPGKEGEKERILRAGEELEVEIVDPFDLSWKAGIQSSESFLLEYYESFLRQHEWPFFRDGTIKHAKAILDAANTGGIHATELGKLRSLLQIIVNYIMRGQGGQESADAGAFADVEGMPAKQAFTLMSRTNFASMHKVLLTDKEKRLFEKIVKNDSVLKEMGLDRKSPVFIKGYGTKHHEPGPTVYQWLAGIVRGVDLLSVQSVKSLSAAMGRYNVETRKGKKDRWMVKFETRNTILGAVEIEAKDWVKYASKLFDTASRRESDALGLLQKQGIVDEAKLVNFVFHARHPELGGRRIRKGERALAQEWRQIRDVLVRPLLQGVQPELPPTIVETEEAWESPPLDLSSPETEHDGPPAAGWSPEPFSEEGEDFEKAGYPDYETEEGAYPAETEGEGVSPEELSPPEAELEEEEFRLNRLPAKARQHFSKGGASWRDAVAEAIGAGINNPNDLADIIFFMQHPERMSSGVGKPITRNESEFFKLRAEWELYRTIATRRLTPSAPCPVFLPTIGSWKYEQYVAAPTTGRITLMLNGRNSGGSGHVDDQTEAFDSMQETVESLGRGDSVFLAAWQLKPTAMDLTRPNPAGMKNWGELFVQKATEGVRIRIIVSDMPPDGVGFKSDVQDLKKLVDKLPASARDNFKFIVSMHPAKLLDPRKLFMDSVNVATHHQKYMVVKKGTSTIAYCGGLDISPPRTPKGWAGFLVWHDIHARLEGRITRDLEREFILRWNREKDKSTEPRHPGWKTLESLAQAPLAPSDLEARKNVHKLQMLRTVSVGAYPHDIRRDDIWQGYFRLIGCATRFIFMENQYFFEPKLADAIVKQAEAQPALIVIIVVSFETDDPTNPYTQHGRALQNEFFTRLFAGTPSTRLRVYTMLGRLVHSKLVLVDDQFLSVGSANANPRGFFMDTELNVMLDDPAAVKGFRHKLWIHDLGLLPGKVASWGVPDFIPQWDVVAKFNDKLRKTPEKMVGESVIPFDPRTVKGQRAPYIPDVLSES